MCERCGSGCLFCYYDMNGQNFTELYSLNNDKNIILTKICMICDNMMVISTDAVNC